MREWTFYTIFFLLLLFIWPMLWRRFRKSAGGNDPSLAMGLVGWLVHAPSVLFAASLSKALALRWFGIDTVGNIILSFLLIALAFISIWRAANRSGYERGLEEGYKKAVVDQPPYR